MRKFNITKPNTSNNIVWVDLEYYDEVEEEPLVLEDEKSVLRFINNVKTVVRSSFEYKEYVKFLKDFVNMRYCKFFENVSNYDHNTNKYDNSIKIEIHHEPFNLHDIVATVLNKHVSLGYNIDELLIAEEVMELHFKNMVGLIPLSLTVHELVHSGKIFIPINETRGNVKKFYKEYKEFMSEDLLDKIHYKVSKTKEYTSEDLYILEKKFTYYRVEDMELPQIINLEEDYNRFVQCRKHINNKKELVIAI